MHIQMAVIQMMKTHSTIKAVSLIAFKQDNSNNHNMEVKCHITKA